MFNGKKIVTILFILCFMLASLFCKPDAENQTLTISATNGSVSVKVDGEELTGASPYEIEKGKSVTLYSYDFNSEVKTIEFNNQSTVKI